MIWQNTIYTIPVIIIIFFSIIGTFYLWIYRKGAQDIIGIAIMIFSIIWMASFMLEQGFTGYQIKVFWNNIQYTGSLILPVCIFLLINQYAGYKKLINIRYIILFSSLPIITLILTLTNELHNLVWKSAKLIVFDSFSLIVKEYNTWYFVFTIYSYILITAGIIIVCKTIIKSFTGQDNENRWKNFLLLPYISIPWLVTLIKALDINPFPNLEEIPIITAISTLVVIAVLNRTKIREIVPMAFNIIFESIDDGIILLDRKDKILKINLATQKIFNTTLSKVSGKPIKNLFSGLASRKKDHNLLMLKDSELAIDNDGNLKQYDIRISKMYRTRGKYVGKVIALRDITKIKKIKENIKYLSLHDSLTGLFNRAYLEEELKRLDTKRQLPISFIMGDVNGLKLVNDAFGHPEGDLLICTAAKILKEHCREEDIIARWGGDEFCMLLPKTTEKDATKIVNRIRKEFKNTKKLKIPLSISFGVSTKENPDQNIKVIIKDAEDNMYRRKLLERKSISSSIISSLERTLWEKSHETEEHANRLKRMATKLGNTINLPESKLDELSLLSTLHDIGKIAIPENILIKKDKLTEKEWKIIKRHPEIGFNIATSSFQIKHIAEAILSHHEYWDGSGYPQGLKGKDIPIISRILSIVDTYDVLTHTRPYRKDIYEEEAAIEEIKRCSGMQFDPELVDKFIKIVNDEILAKAKS